MILRSFNKENIAHQSGQLIDIANKQAALSSDGSFETLQEKKEELSIHEINSQVLQRELIRFSESMEAQRRDKNRLTQGLAKMDEEVKILKAQRDSYLCENQKLRYQLKNSYEKVRQVQQKANFQTNQFYQVKNQNATLNLQISQLKNLGIQLQEQLKQSASNENNLRIQNQDLQVSISDLLNEIKQKNFEVDSFRAKLWELENQKTRILEGEGLKALSRENQFSKLCSQLNNSKIAYEKKESELLSKTLLLHEENMSMKKALEKLSKDQKLKSSFGLQRTCSLPSETDNNEYHIKLFVKQSQIEKLNQRIRELESKVQMITLQNGLLTQNLGNCGISVKGYQKYAAIESQILKSSLNRQGWCNENEIEAKDKQIECLHEKISEHLQKLQSSEISLRRAQAELKAIEIDHQNYIGDLTASKCQLERQINQIKAKMQSLQNECKEKDKVIFGLLKKDKL